MEHKLFRQQALQHQLTASQGDVFVLPSLPVRMISLMITGWVIVMAWYLNSQEYKTFTRINGWLEMSEGSTPVYPDNTGGRVAAILVKNGDEVEAGTPLLQINSGQTLGSGEDVHFAVHSQYEVQQEQLEQQLSYLKIAHKLAIATTRTTGKQLERDISKLNGLIELVAQRIALAETSANSMATLADARLLAKNEHLSAARAVLSLKQELLEYQRERESKLAYLEENRHELTRLPASQEQERLDLQHQLSALRNQMLQWDSQHKKMITASRAGVVSDLSVRSGDFINTSKPLLNIQPSSDTLTGKVLLPARSSGLLQQGQSVRIKLDAFPYQQYGTVDGIITLISDDLIQPQSKQWFPVTTDEPAYLVQVSLNKQSIATYGQEKPLRSGMTFSADVTTRESSLIEWLFAPLLSVKGAW